MGDESTTVMVNGIFPESAKAVAPEIRTALLSTVYAAGQSTAVESENFKVDVTGTEFKLVSNISGMLLYTTDGKVVTTGAALIVGESIAPISGDKKEYALQRYKKYPRGETNTVSEVRQITINGLSGYEIVGSGENKDGKPQLIYQVMLYPSDSRYFIMTGTSNIAQAEVALPALRRISQTFQASDKLK